MNMNILARKVGLNSACDLKKGALIRLGCDPFIEGVPNYRILDINDTMIKVMAMFEYNDGYGFSKPTTTTKFKREENLPDKFDQYEKIYPDTLFYGMQYADSGIDKKMAKFYNELPYDITKAIVEQNISQSLYESHYILNDYIINKAPVNGMSWFLKDFSSDDDFKFKKNAVKYAVSKVASASIGKRNIFILDIDDIIAYLGNNWTPQQLNMMLFGTDNSVDETILLRSSVFSCMNNSGLMNVLGANGRILSSDLYMVKIRPVFVLDLMQL